MKVNWLRVAVEMEECEWTPDELAALDEREVLLDMRLYELPHYAHEQQQQQEEEVVVEQEEEGQEQEQDEEEEEEGEERGLKRRRLADDAGAVDAQLAEQAPVYLFADAPFGEEALQVSGGERSGFVILGPHIKHLRKYTSASVDCIRDGTCLLGVPFEQIRHEAMAMLVQEEIDKRDALGRQESAQPKHLGSCELWVSKYRPSLFVHLLSDENTNRLVLKWIKSWDSYVFGRQKVRHPQLVAPNPVHLSVNTMASAAGQFGKRAFNRDAVWGQAHGQSVVGTLDSDGLPEKKVLLLHGPPGTGKTTLAHILASQAGYKSVEINASDERTGDVIMDRLIAYTTTRQLDSSDARPVLVVMDEIDGLDGRDGKGGVDALIRLIKGEAGKKKNIRLQRPIICVCNDVFAPVLRPLKEHAIVIELHHAQQSALVERLRNICKAEKISVETSALSQLVLQSKFDIRSSLNSLQFLSRRSRRAAGGEASSTSSMVQLDSVGLKDMAASRSPFDIWKDIFMVPRQANTRKVVGTAHTSQKKGAWGSRSDLEDALNAQGDGIDVIIEGCMANYSSVRYQDPNFDKTITVLDAVSDNDVCSSAMKKSGSFSKRYDVLVPMYFAQYTAGVERPSVNYPRSASEYRNSLTHRRSYLQQMRLASSLSRGSLLSENELSVDLVSPILDMIHPPSLAVAQKRAPKPAENKLIAHVVDIMSQFGIFYSMHVTVDGSILKLDPPISEFASYNSEKNDKVKFKKPEAVSKEVVIVFSKDYCGRSLPEEVKRLVYQMPKMVEMRMQNAGNKAVGDGIPVGRVTKIDKQLEKEKMGGKRAASGNTKISMFGYGSMGEKRTVVCQVGNFPVRYKYHEGITNAVRRAMRASDLL